MGFHHIIFPNCFASLGSQIAGRVQNAPVLLSEYPLDVFVGGGGGVSPVGERAWLWSESHPPKKCVPCSSKPWLEAPCRRRDSHKSSGEEWAREVPPAISIPSPLALCCSLLLSLQLPVLCLLNSYLNTRKQSITHRGNSLWSAK